MKIVKNLGLAFVCTLALPQFISDTTLTFSNSVFSILWMTILFLLFRYAEQKECCKGKRKHTCILGFLFSCMTAFGRSLEVRETVYYSSLPLLLSILLYAYVYSVALSVLWTFLDHNEQKMQVNHAEGKALIRLQNAIVWVLDRPVVLAVILLLCWTPCYISSFPGGFVYDMTVEFEQMNNGYDGSFPLLHSVLITRILSIAYALTGSYNTGIAFYAIAQMILCALMYTNILRTFYQRQVNPFLLGILLLYCAVFPIIQMLVTQIVRDILFSVLLTYTMFLLYLMCSDRHGFMSRPRNPIRLAVVLVLTMLARNNNAGVVMAIIVAAISAIVLLVNYKDHLRNALVFAGSAVGCYVVLGFALTALCQPLTPAESNDYLSILTQPIARAYFLEQDSWTQEEKAEFEEWFVTDGLRYVAENADTTKGRLVIDGNWQDFLAFWLKIGMKHPGCYLDAIFANTRQMWYPGSVVDGYNEMGIYEKYEKCYYGFTENIDRPGVHMQLLPSVRQFYKEIGLYISFEKIPVISMLFSIGFQFWIVLHCAFYIAYRKRRRLYLPVAIILLYTLISAFVPLVLLRYFAALFFTLPMTIIFTIQPTAASCPAKPDAQ